MLSGALAAILKVGAVAVTTAGLGAGVYFLAQAGEGQDAADRVQAPATIETPGQLSPPNVIALTATPAEPTPTFPPAPITPPPNIDTSDWKTYESPLGFSLKSPPDWIVQDKEANGLPRGTARIIEGATWKGIESGEIVNEGGTARLPPGRFAIWLDIAGTQRQFDAAWEVSVCVPENRAVGAPHPDQQATLVTFAGRPAVVCSSTDLSRDGGHRFAGVHYAFALPSGATVMIGATTIDANEEVFP